ncbi:hypothetical protein R6Q59_005896 [Mikania micrantha]
MESVKNNGIDLRLALGVANQQGEMFSDKDAGANANSRSKTDTIMRPHPLSELVWSTQNGLSIKCGGCFAGMNPCGVVALPSQHDEKCENDGEVKCEHLIEMKAQNTCKGKECMSIQVGNVTGTSEGNIGLMQDISESTSCEPSSLEKIEETAENDVIVKAAEKVREDSSGESLESCNSGSKKNRRKGFEHQLTSGSKRLKKQSQECGVAKKQDSSFMSWISNMVKPNQQDEAHHQVDHKTVDNVVSNIFGFRSVFQSLYSRRLEETKTQGKSSKEEGGGLQIKESHDCLPINESKDLLLKKTMDVSNLNQFASTSENNKLQNQDKILKIPKDIFDTIRRLRLSRTEILKWMNSRSSVANLDGYFLRLRLAKWEEGVGEAGYYVASITDENPSKGFKQPIRVNIGGVQCLVECRYISNCDFLEDELVAWWRTTLKSGQAPMEADLTSKLEEKKKLGLSFS